MATKAKRQTTPRTPMEETLTFELEVSFPAELDPDASTLMETVSDAIRDYDYRRRLLPGSPLLRGRDRLTGISLSLNKTRTEVDRLRVMTSQPAPPDPPEREKTEPTRHAIIEVSTQIDDRIERLREIQARLWEIFDALWKADSARRVTQAGQQAERAIASASDLLAGKLPTPKRNRPTRHK